jgi:hypothetical protein
MSYEKNKIVKYFILSFIIILCFKVDYRFKEILPGGSQDDSSYYYHAQTIALDFDLDYNNQLNGNFQDAFIREDNKPVPRQSFGPGLLSAPFIFASSQLSKYISVSSNTSLNYFIYSLSAPFYLFLSLVILKKLLRINNQSKSEKLILLTLGSGVTYYAFERFSMSTIYEFFSVCLILYLVSRVYNSEENRIYIFLLPVVQFIMLTNRWNNLHFFLIPVIYGLLYKKPLKVVFKNFYFYIGNITGVLLFLAHSKMLYGIYTLSQQSIYPSSDWVVNERLQNFLQLENLFENIIIAIKYLLTTCFSPEFGIFYFSAIIFSSFYFLFHYLLNKRFYEFLFLTFFYIIPFLPILIFENHGTSYGFRYLFTLAPLNLVIYFKEFLNHKLLTRYLVLFSIFGIFSQLFFETTPLTSLSEGTILNSFNSLSPYSNPTYLYGLFSSFLVLSAYLKIIFTSFAGVLLIKFINLFFNFEKFLNDIYQVDAQLSNLLYSIDNFSWLLLISTVILILLSSRSLLGKNYD